MLARLGSLFRLLACVRRICVVLQTVFFVCAKRYAASFGGKKRLWILGSGAADSFVVNVSQILLVAKESGRKPRAFRKRGKQKFLTGQKFY